MQNTVQLTDNYTMNKYIKVLIILQVISFAIMYSLYKSKPTQSVIGRSYCTMRKSRLTSYKDYAVVIKNPNGDEEIFSEEYFLQNAEHSLALCNSNLGMIK